MKHTICKLALVLQRSGRLDAGQYIKPVYAMTFERNGKACVSPVRNNGQRRPLGQDALDSMRDYIRRGEVTESAVLDCRVID